MQASITYKHDLPCSTVELLFLKICKNLTMKLEVRYLPNFIFRCKFLYLATQNCLRSGNEKNINMILGCKRIHKPGGDIFWIFTDFHRVMTNFINGVTNPEMSIKCISISSHSHKQLYLPVYIKKSIQNT